MFDQIMREAGLSEVEVDVTASYVEDDHDGCFMETNAYEKLYEYFCNSGEMPYGVAKARTGDPDVWILEYLEELV